MAAAEIRAEITSTSAAQLRSSSAVAFKQYNTVRSVAVCAKHHKSGAMSTGRCQTRWTWVQPNDTRRDDFIVVLLASRTSCLMCDEQATKQQSCSQLF